MLEANKIRGQMEALARHWAYGPRAIGHTYAMRAGSDNVPCVILAHDMRHARELTRMGNVITPDYLPERLLGMRLPLVADHFAMGLLCSRAAATIAELQHEVQRLREGA